MVSVKIAEFNFNCLTLLNYCYHEHEAYINILYIIYNIIMVVFSLNQGIVTKQFLTCVTLTSLWKDSRLTLLEVPVGLAEWLSLGIFLPGYLRPGHRIV